MTTPATQKKETANTILTSEEALDMPRVEYVAAISSNGENVLLQQLG
jgi:hypothetical protein